MSNNQKPRTSPRNEREMAVGLLLFGGVRVPDRYALIKERER